MTSRPVLTYPNTTLRTTPQEVTTFGTPELIELLDEMVDTMRAYRGVGLAATQIGVDQQIAVIELKDGPLILINPKLEKVKNTTDEDEEGCLSLPGIFGNVPRSISLTLKAQDAYGKHFSLDAKGLLARVIQHEYDHLHGHLYIDRATKLTTGLDKARELGITLSAS